MIERIDMSIDIALPAITSLRAPEIGTMWIDKPFHSRVTSWNIVTREDTSRTCLINGRAALEYAGRADTIYGDERLNDISQELWT